MATDSVESIILDKNYIVDKLSTILNKSHTKLEKRNIKYFPERLNVACPICGDSDKISSKKRGNLYFKNLMFKCYNCGRYVSFTQLCSYFNIDIPIEKRLELYNYIDNNTYLSADSDEYVITKLDKLIKLDDMLSHYNTHPESEITDFKPIEVGSEVYKYLLNNRNISNDTNLYQAVYHYTPTWSEPVVVILNKHKNLVIGMQLRNLKDEKKKRFYKIYEFVDIYKEVYKDRQIDEFESIAYNKLSHFINILNVNFSKPVTVFEGYFDSSFFPNSIGVIGINTDMTFLLKDKSLNVRFFFDNDDDGYKASKKKLIEGYSVFMWRLLFKNILKNKKDKYSAQVRLSGIKDLNKLAKETKTPPYNLLKLEQYFSNDEFDMMYLDNKTPLINLL